MLLSGSSTPPRQLTSSQVLNVGNWATGPMPCAPLDEPVAGQFYHCPLSSASRALLLPSRVVSKGIRYQMNGCKQAP